MKVYSWNILFKNQELERVFAFIRDSEWDVFCLQEVPEEFLAKIRTLPIKVEAVVEANRQLTGGKIAVYIVILSRYPIANTKPIPLPYKEEHGSLREKIYVRTMSTIGLLTKRVGPRHLSLQHPGTRLAEFEIAMIERDPSIPSIVCGDFNILESPHITPINFFRGGSISDTVLYTRERTSLEKRFFEHELTNPLLGSNTHPLSRSQLDHILVSKSFSIKDARVLSERMGSDHCPIRVDIS